jgi:competence ComEA-like helix-hairpin-helix protein
MSSLLPTIFHGTPAETESDLTRARDGRMTALHGLVVLFLAALIVWTMGPGSTVWNALFPFRSANGGDCVYQVFRGNSCEGTLFASESMDLSAILEELGLGSARDRGAAREKTPCDRALFLAGNGSGKIAVRKMSGAQLLCAGRPIDINLADETDLKTVPGIGDRLAQEIVAWRRSYGPFSSVEDLTAVPRIGKRKLAHIRPFLTSGSITGYRPSSARQGRSESP